VLAAGVVGFFHHGCLFLNVCLMIVGFVNQTVWQPAFFQIILI